MGLLEPGSVFADFRIDTVIARGGMGVVYLADQENPHRRVALKLIAPERADDPDYRDRFLRESELLAALEHPNIVPIHAAGEWEGRLYLAMRYVDGPTLAQRLTDDGPLGVDETIRILAPVADALDAAHEQGLIHRDVKPANILLSRRGHVYLTDFGLTKRAGSATGLTMPGIAIGTEGFMAPEQFTGAGDPSLAYRIDIYALACVIHACLTGVEPFPRGSYEAVMWAHVFAPPPRISERRPDLGERFDGVLARAMAKEPAERPASATELVGDLRTASQGLMSSDLDRRSGMPGQAQLADIEMTRNRIDVEADPRDDRIEIVLNDEGTRPDGSIAHDMTSDATRRPSPLGIEQPDRARPTPVADGRAGLTNRGEDGTNESRDVAPRSGEAGWRRPIAMLLVVAVIVAVAGFLGIRALLGTGVGGVGSAASPSSASSLPSVAASTPAADAANATLLSILPPDFGGCHDPDERLPGSTATIHCLDTGTPAQVIYNSFADRASLDAAWSEYLRAKNFIAGSGACPTNRGEMPWSTGSAPAPVVERGRLLCYVSGTPEAVIQKTSYDPPVWATTWQPGRDLAAVHALVASGMFDVGPSIVDIVATNMAFVPSEAVVSAGTPLRLRLRNEDAGVLHGVTIRRVGSGVEVFAAEPFVGVDTQTFEIPALAQGEYLLVCPVHSTMTAAIKANG